MRSRAHMVYACSDTYDRSSDRICNEDETARRSWKWLKFPEEPGDGEGEQRGEKYESEVVGGCRPTFSPLKKCSLKSHSTLQLSLAFYFTPLPFLSFFFFYWFQRPSEMAHTHAPLLFPMPTQGF